MAATGKSSAGSKTSTKSKSTASAKKNTGSRTSRGKVDSKIRLEAIVLLLFCFFMTLFLCMVGVIKGAFGPAVKGWMLGVFGLLAYALPILLFVAVCFRIANKGNPAATLKIAAAYVLLFMVGVLLCSRMKLDDIMSGGHIAKDLYEYRGGGGFLFGILACLLHKAFGRVGTIILASVFAVISLVVLTEKSLLAFLKNGGTKIYDSVKAGKEYIDEELYGEEEPDEEEEERWRRLEEEKERRAEKLAQKRERELEEKARAREEARLRREEQKRKRQEEEERRRREEDQKDDERILESSRPKEKTVNFDLTSAKTLESGLRKDELHEINLFVPEEEAVPSHSQDYIAPDVKGLPSYGASEIREITYNEKETEEHEPVVPYRVPMPESGGGAHEEEYVPVMPKDSFVADPSPKTMPEADKPRTSPPSGQQTAQAPSPDPLPDLSGMPEPVTERTHRQNASVQTAAEKPKPVKRRKYAFPPVDLLRRSDKKNKGDSDQQLKETALLLQQTLKTFGVAVTVTDISQGPSVTRYELQLGEGIKVNKIVNLADDIKLNLAAQDIRIEAPIPGKAAVGIEIPNKETSDVLIRELLDSAEFQASASKMTFAVGKDISGKTIVADIAKMPHMLIAGATGSGKSVCINTLIMSILYKAAPEEVKLIMIDPKVVELSVYNGIPHLMIPVVTDPRKASAALQWAVAEMTKRYQLFADLGVRDLKGYNAKIAPDVNENDPEAPKILPQIVVIVDELADLMMVASKEVEEAICRLAQLARAAGIHLIIATQRPSVDVITGLIKANMPSRVAFKVTSGVDSRTILDMVGAEKLLGKGDMLFFPQGYTKPLRVQGAFVSDGEVEAVVGFLKSNAGDDVYDEEVEKQISGISSGPEGNGVSSEGGGANNYDDYFAEACRFVVEKEKASSGMLQRVFKIGFNRAGRIVDQMEEAGVVGPEEGTKPRKVLMTKSELEIFLSEMGY